MKRLLWIVLALAGFAAQAATIGVVQVVDTVPAGSCNTKTVRVVKDDAGNNGEHYCCVSGTWASCDVGAGGGGGVATSDSPTWTGDHTWQQAVLNSQTGSVTSVRAWDYDGDGTYEMTDLQSIVTAYGSDLRLVVPAVSWVAPDNSANTSGVLEITADNVTLDCEPGAVLNGPKQYFGTHDGSDNAATLSDSTASFGDLTGYTLDNLTDGSSCTVTSNTSTTATCTLTGGTGNDWDATGGAGGPDAYSLELDVMSTVYVSGDDFTMRGCEIDGGVPSADLTGENLEGVNIQKHGVRLIGTQRFWILDNYMHNLNHAGIITVSASDGVIRGNRVIRTGRFGSTPPVSSTENGIQLYTETGDSDTRNIVVQGNLVEKFTGNGIALRKADQNDTVQDILIDSNVIRDQESASGSCVNPLGGENVVISNTVARNCRLHVTGDTDYLSNATAGSVGSTRNVLISGFELDNSAWTATSQDIKIGEHNDGLTLRDIRVHSSGNGTCLEYDPPNRDFVADGITLIDCAGAGATDGAILVQNTSGTEDAGVTGREAQWRNITIIDPATPAMRNIVATTGWLFENWKVTGHSTVNAGILRFIIDSAASSRLTFRNIDLETDNTSTSVDGVEFAAANLTDSVFENFTCRDLNGVCIHLESGGSDNSFDQIRAYHTTNGGGAIDTGSSTGPRFGDVFCENEASDCVTGSGSGRVASNTTEGLRGVIVKAGDETVNNSATIQDDDELTFPAAANTTYLIEVQLIVSSATATPDIDFALVCPTSSTSELSAIVYGANATLIKSYTSRFCGGEIQMDVPAAGEAVGRLVGIVSTAGTAGDIKIQWAQNSATAENTVVQDQSYIKWEAVD